MPLLYSAIGDLLQYSLRMPKIIFSAWVDLMKIFFLFRQTSDPKKSQQC